jgi:Cytochrome P450
MATRDVEIGGYRVESGTMLAFGRLAVQRDPTLWEEPLIFDPDPFSPENAVGPVIEFIDHRDEQLQELRSLRPPPDPELVAEPCRWAYYPWRRTVVAVLGPRAFRAVRTDRNRNLITAEEQTRLGALRIGVAGLSVGHVIAHTLAAEGLGASFGWRISIALSCPISTGCRRPYWTSG